VDALLSEPQPTSARPSVTIMVAAVECLIDQEASPSTLN
jgi:hypothetical protein